MGDRPSVEDLCARLQARRYEARRDAIAEALSDQRADGLLAQMLPAAQSSERVTIAAHLGDRKGDAGTAALRAAVETSGPGSRGVRCAALLALAKRGGADATPWLREALRASDGAVKDYAVIGLAGKGTDAAWAEVESLVEQLVRRKHRSGDSPVLMAVAYLGQHVQNSPERLGRLVALVREHWSRLDADERAWVESYWPRVVPDAQVGEVDAPDAAALNRWVLDTSLFEPVPMDML